MIDERWADEDSIRIPFRVRSAGVVPHGSAERERLIPNIEYDAKAAAFYDLERDPGEERNLLETDEGKQLRESLAPTLRALRSAARAGATGR